jgi:hypothetical protein
LLQHLRVKLIPRSILHPLQGRLIAGGIHRMDTWKIDIHPMGVELAFAMALIEHHRLDRRKKVIEQSISTLPMMISGAFNQVVQVGIPRADRRSPTLRLHTQTLSSSSLGPLRPRPYNVEGMKRHDWDRRPDERRRWQKRRPRYVRRLRHPPGPVQGSRFVQLPRNVLEPGQEHHHRKPGDFPNRDAGQRKQRRVRRRQQARLPDAHCLERPPGQTCVRVQHPQQGHLGPPYAREPDDCGRRS